MTSPMDTIADQRFARPGADELAWRELIHDELRSLRNGLIVVGVLVVAALGIGVWGLLSAQAARDGRSAASVTRVRSQERRIDRLEARLERAPSAADVANLRGRLDAVESDVRGAQQSTNALEVQVRQLEQRVDDLAKQPPPTPTPTP